MADVEDSHARAHRHVLCDYAAANACGIFNRHVPAVELNHLRAELPVRSVERSFADCGCGFDRRQMTSITGDSWAASRKLMSLTCCRQTLQIRSAGKW